MQLEGYELLELVVDGGIQVSKLREQKSGGLFQLHAFHGGMLEEFQKVCLDFPCIPPQVSRVVKVSQDHGSGYILTELLPEGVGIRAWIRRLREAPLAQGQNPAISRTLVENLRKLAMEPGALQPIAPGPEKPDPAPTAPPNSAASDGEMTPAYRLATQLRMRDQGTGSVPVAEAGSSGSRPGEPPPDPPDTARAAPNAIQPAGRSASPAADRDANSSGELTELMARRRAAKGAVSRPELPPAPTPIRTSERAPSLRAPELPPKPMPEVCATNVPLHIESSPEPAAHANPGLGTWLTQKTGGLSGASPPRAAAAAPPTGPAPVYRPLPTPDAEPELPMPPVPRTRGVDSQPDPASTRLYPTPEVPPPVAQRPALSLPPTRPQREESAWHVGMEWRFVVWTVGGLIMALAVVLWLVEKIG